MRIKTAFEKASNVELKPHKLEALFRTGNTMAFMFETRYPQRAIARETRKAGRFRSR
jgi:homogentisate 1,2-dioxygenase